MKKNFKRDVFFGEKGILFDETINSGFDPTIFTGKKKLSKKQTDQYLTDLGSDSDTEYQSAKILYDHQNKSPRFLDWLIECCEKENTYLNSSLCWAFLNFQDDERVLPAIIKSVSKCPDEDLSNYAALLGIFGGKEAKDVLKERFYKLKDNPESFAKHKHWNDLGFSLMYICEVLIELEPDNREVAECLVKLVKHPTTFNRESAIGKIVHFLKFNYRFRYGQTRSLFIKALEPISQTNNSRLFGMLLPYLFQVKPDQTYEKFKKIYLKTKKEYRNHYLVFFLLHSVENPLFWISKLVRELPYEDTEYFREYLSQNQVRSISNEELVSAIRESFASESPNTRISTINQLENITNEDAKKVLEEALIDEPDEFIRKQFEKHLKKLKK